MGNLQLQIINSDSAVSTKNLEISSDFEKAKKISIKNTLVLSIDYQKYKKGIVWDDFNELEIEIKGKLKELAYYASVQVSLKKIIDDFNYLDYSNNLKIQQLAEAAFEIINNTTEPKYLLGLVLSKRIHLDDLDHTIKQEVEILMQRKPTSSKQKEGLVANALNRLRSDIEDFILVLKTFKVS